jgi:hypothetical protein
MNSSRLVNDINLQIRNLKRLNEEMKEVLNKIKGEPTFIEIRACASILQDFYSGIEKIFERIALVIDKNLPKGENWHSELLSQMKEPVTDIRPSVISEELLKNLKKYLDYRHLFRHIYGFELKWEKIKPLMSGNE